MGKRLTKLRSPEVNLNQFQSLETLQSIRDRLIAIIGYEFWNPLSTIQVCLESLANESEITPPYNNGVYLDALPRESCAEAESHRCSERWSTMANRSRQIILDIAAKDIRYLHQLIEDCVNIAHYREERAKQDCVKKSQTASQQILHNTIFGILQSNLIETNTKFLYSDNNYVLVDVQEEILEHICNNLIAIVGHELRTPICTIEVCLESLTNEPQMPREYRQEMLDIALQDLVRLQKLIKDFFTLDRLEKGQIYHRCEYIRVDEAIDLALVSLNTKFNCLLVSNKANRKSLPKIIVEIPADLPQVKVDEDSLVTALVKLLDNACKFTKADGEIKIQVRLIGSKIPSIFNKETTKMMLEIIISDNGRGIIPSNLEAIFNCFYQEEDFLRRTVNGTGIGLTICRRIINSLGGKIWANSAGKDRGSSIHFTLPIAT